LSIFENIADKRAVSIDELDRMRFAVARAEAALAQATAASEAAKARVAAIDVDLARQTVTAPIAGQILSVDARPGEYAAAGPLAAPLMTMGATDRLHVRVEIDESDIGRFSSAGRAVATPRGEAARDLPLTFVRIEPRATAKRTLAGGSERVDARVIEVVYALQPGAGAIVGQRLDIFIDASGAADIAKAAS
ncbi:MAG: HlyD family efflux transporter periplasmic adaptor subunit, partial [Parvularculaceae bacterium]